MQAACSGCGGLERRRFPHGSRLWKGLWGSCINQLVCSPELKKLKWRRRLVVPPLKVETVWQGRRRACHHECRFDSLSRAWRQNSGPLSGAISNLQAVGCSRFL